MKILITGGCGFIGSSLAIFLKEKIKTVQITSIDNLSRKGSTLNKNRITKNKISNIKIDISKFSSIKKLKKFDLVIHLSLIHISEPTRPY